MRLKLVVAKQVKIPMPDAHFCKSAQGWLELGNPREALRELKKIHADFQGHPVVLAVWLDAWIASGRWAQARQLGEKLCSEFPGEPGFWLGCAYATRRSRGGGLAAASAVLERVVDMFPKEWAVPFNLACYHCKLEKMEDAQRLLMRAVRIGGESVRQAALHDEDLESLWMWVANELPMTGDSTN